MNVDKYEAQLRKLQIELVKSQIRAIKDGQKALIIFEGRDAAGKDGAIKRITEHLSPRNTRVVALPKPSDREQSEWYFQRYVRYLPAGGEWVLFNRSWYNRGGVEVVMDFSTAAEQEQFLLDVPSFERMLVQSGVVLIKYWLDVSREEQHKWLQDRRTDPLKKLKTGPMDVEAEKRFDAYTRARDDMLIRTHSPVAPWICVRSDNKKAARLNIMRQLLHTLAGAQLAKKTPGPDKDVLFAFDSEALNDGRLAR